MCHSNFLKKTCVAIKKCWKPLVYNNSKKNCTFIAGVTEQSAVDVVKVLPHLISYENHEIKFSTSTASPAAFVENS